MDIIYRDSLDTAGLILIGLFYLFFFLRALFLSQKIGRSIKSRDAVLNLAITSAGITTVLYLLSVLLPESNRFLVLLHLPRIVELFGIGFIALGLILSTAASLNLGKSWRVGIDSTEKTDLVQTGIYRVSRNPYFLSYDAVLIGIVLNTTSLVVLITAVATILLFHQLILKEEEFLEKMHGEDYIIYKDKVGRYL